MQQKARAQRVDRTYFKRVHPWRTSYRSLNWLLPIVGGAVMAALLYTPTGDNAYLPGPVSSKHAIFGHRCIECHESGPGGWGAVTDAKCISCHDGPIHHFNMVIPGGNTKLEWNPETGKPVQVQTATCASCHSEHRGNQELSKISDRHCTQCHQDLKVTEGAPRFAAKITSFEGDHPDFKILTGGKDTTPVKYNHKKHIELKWSEDAIKERQKLDDTFIKVPGATLECYDCHAPDSDRNYMQPISFEVHCQMCHPLAIAPIANIGDVKLPHAQSDIVAAKVSASFKDYLIQQGGKLPPKLAPNPKYKKPRPGQKAKDPEFIEQPEDRPPEKWIADNVKDTLEPLFKDGGACAYCHEVDGKIAGTELPKYVDPQIPRSWFPRNPNTPGGVTSVFFDHESHRVLNCLECHNTATTSEKTSDVLLPGKSNCVVCHSLKGGASSNCNECHLYHDKSISNFIGMRTFKDLHEGTATPAGKIKTVEHLHHPEAKKTEPEAKHEDHKTEAPKTEAAKTEPAKTEAAKTEAAKTEAVAEPAAAPKEQAPVQDATTQLCANCGMRWPLKTKFCSRCGAGMKAP
ncbi:MAG: cytochrome c3 family protein [Planctomycetota bacterium]|nr:cytochrome c3 family protein [Planctomycetota bacterium]